MLAISFIFYGVLLFAVVVANEEPEVSDEAEEKRNLGVRRGFSGGCGGAPALLSTGTPCMMGGGSSVLGQLKMDGAQSSIFRAQAKGIRKGYFQPTAASYEDSEAQLMTEIIPEVIQPAPIIIPIAFSAPAAAPAAAPFAAPAAAPFAAPAAAQAPIIEPIVIETFVEPSAQRDSSSIGKELLLQRISDRLDDRLRQPVNVQLATVPLQQAPLQQFPAIQQFSPMQQLSPMQQFSPMQQLAAAGLYTIAQGTQVAAPALAVPAFAQTAPTFLQPSVTSTFTATGKSSY